MSELEELMKVFGESGGDNSILVREDSAHFVASGNKILSTRATQGLEIKAEETATGITARVRVLEGTIIKNPVHLCFGVLHKKGIQEIKMNVTLEKNSSARFIAHCIFPKAVVKVGKDGRYFSDFSLITGMVGKLGIDYTIEVGENAVTELIARVFGHGDDKISIIEKVVLEGENSRGLIKTRVALEDRAQAEVTGITEGSAAGARGHVDCMEIVKDSAIAKAIPIVNVMHPLAKVTHEAAIGSVDKRQLETLMAHGLTPEEAVDVIVKGILK